MDKQTTVRTLQNDLLNILRQLNKYAVEAQVKQQNSTSKKSSFTGENTQDFMFKNKPNW